MIDVITCNDHHFLSRHSSPNNTVISSQHGVCLISCSLYPSPHPFTKLNMWVCNVYFITPMGNIIPWEKFTQLLPR